MPIPHETWLKKQSGRSWCLSHYYGAPPKHIKMPWWLHEQAKALHERGLLMKSLRVPNEWQITPAGIALHDQLYGVAPT